MSAVKKIMKALGFARKVTHTHLTIAKRPGEDEGAIVVEMPVREYSNNAIDPKNEPAVTILIYITH
ncbi:hypothetical protein [Ferruginibacter sp. HRS2-29]|uniref:hypothetical protein n=1 Tax=Ferruginibacter sp. HRS2-29 TaxID=2487334 RepID=UPI0020CF59D6|nr:hypothetical protein [Ferruginibacter sp. HRS2-29]